MESTRDERHEFRRGGKGSLNLSDSGCHQTPVSDSENGTHFTPPALLLRSVSDSPSHYFLRGRWASTPLLKTEGKSLSMSCSPPYPTCPPAPTFSSPAATSTPDANNLGYGKSGVSIGSSSYNFSSLSHIEAPSSLSKLVRSTDDAKVSSLSQLGPDEFQKRIENLETTADSLGRSSDSGIGSLLQSPQLDNSSDSRVVQKAPRRSPRHLALTNRLDRCSRLKVNYRRKLKTTSYVTAPGLYCGQQRVDFISLLAERDIWQLVELILSQLSAADLCSFSLVDPAWNSTLESRVLQNQRRLQFVEQKKINRENLGEDIFKTRSSSRIAMQEVNRNMSPVIKRTRSEADSSSEKIHSPSKIKSRLFDDVDLVVDKLLHCPNCSFTSSVSKKSLSGDERGVCGSKSCGLIFCTRCLYSEHPGKPCRTIQTIKSKQSVVSSKKSKARLRRL